MKEPVLIRGAVEGDYEAVRRLVEMDFRFHQNARPDYFSADLTDSYPADEFQALLSLPCPIALVAEQGGQIVGICFGKVGPGREGPLFRSRKIALIDELFTLPAFRGLGIATALLTRARERGRAGGAQAMELGVYGFNERARRLYERFGMGVQYIRMEQPLESES